MNIANYVAVNKKYQLDKDFVKAVSDNYQAGIESLDFNSQKSADRINSWCDKQTKGMIPKFIDRMEPSAVSYLLNAIYFKGTWMNEFDKNDTKLEYFRGYTRDIKKVEMMHQKEKFDYYENETFKAVQLLYGNGTYCMTVMLPNEGKSIDGKVFDSSYKRNPQTTTFGLNQVIKGWTEALQLMPVGSKWEIYIPYDLAYGEAGAHGSIPPYSALIFKVEVIKVL